MSEADKMFKELGYCKKQAYPEVDKKMYCETFYTTETLIEFRFDTRSINITNWINIQELKAINKKCEELGWL